MREMFLEHLKRQGSYNHKKNVDKWTRFRLVWTKFHFNPKRSRSNNSVVVPPLVSTRGVQTLPFVSPSISLSPLYFLILFDHMTLSPRRRPHPPPSRRAHDQIRSWKCAVSAAVCFCRYSSSQRQDGLYYTNYSKYDGFKEVFKDEISGLEGFNYFFFTQDIISERYL